MFWTAGIYAITYLSVANLTRQHPQAQPAPQEIEEMNYHASTVMHLLEDLRRLEGGEEVSRKEGDYPASANPADEQARPPKRPWEDMAREGEPPSAIVHYDVSVVPPCSCPCSSPMLNLLIDPFR